MTSFYFNQYESEGFADKQLSEMNEELARRLRDAYPDGIANVDGGEYDMTRTYIAEDIALEFTGAMIVAEEISGN